MKLSSLKVNHEYIVKTNTNTRLLEYGLTEGTKVKLVNIFDGWIYIFNVRDSKIGIRKTELNNVTWSHPK